MKVFLRILVILLSLGIVIMALLPTGREEPEPSKPETVSSSPTPAPDTSTQQSVIRDLLGGAALDSGKKAKNMIGEINTKRTEQLKELED
ncbi:MAG: hypothetical protein PF795_02125 [Kiritimatiellae bacterium]|jgi:hypothetical protein|nr:hypothetical protein [Kiritimatiellia bacterium]